MNLKKLFSLISSLTLPTTIFTTTISWTKKSDSSKVDFGIKGDIIKTANYLLKDKINDSYIMSYMEGFLIMYL